MKGTVRVIVKIAADGQPFGVTHTGGAGLSSTVIRCVEHRVARAQFAPPDGGGATNVIPVSFSPQ